MGNSREYPLEFWGYYAGFVQGDSAPPVEDVYAQWLADKEKERQEEFKEGRRQKESPEVNRKSRKRKSAGDRKRLKMKGGEKAISRRGRSSRAGMSGRMPDISTMPAMSRM